MGGRPVHRLPLAKARQKSRPAVLGQGPARHGFGVIGLPRVPGQEDHRPRLPQRVHGGRAQGQSSAAGDDQSLPPGQLPRRLHLPGAEIVLPALGKDVRDGAALPLHDEGVGIHQLPPQAPGQQAAAGGLAAAHHANEYDVFHISLRTSGSCPGPGGSQRSGKAPGAPHPWPDRPGRR